MNEKQSAIVIFFCKNLSCEETESAIAWKTLLIEETQTIVKQF